MTTNWYNPNNITQESEFEDFENHIQWQKGVTKTLDQYGIPTDFPNYDLNTGGSLIQSSKPLLYISNDGHAPLRMKTWYLHLTDFRIADVPEVISGVELKTIVRRKGRIMDETISLRHNDNLLGENKINYNTDDLGHVPIYNATSYGNMTDLWDAVLTPEIITDSSFGVTLRFQSHLFYPHRETVLVESVELRVY